MITVYKALQSAFLEINIKLNAFYVIYMIIRIYGTPIFFASINILYNLHFSENWCQAWQMYWVPGKDAETESGPYGLHNRNK